MSKWIVYGFIAGFLFLQNSRVFCVSTPSVLEQLQQEIQGILSKNQPAVVTISSKSVHATRSSDDGLLSLFREKTQDNTYVLHQVWTGVIYNEDGYIVTKNRYITDVDKLFVTLHDGTQYTPELIGVDPATGLAVLRITADELHAVQLEESGGVQRGAWMTIISNTLGIAPSIAFGIVDDIYPAELFEISTNIQPGNNGSPVFDVKGNLAGIIVAQIESRKSVVGSEGRGLALPAKRLVDIVELIIKSPNVNQAWIGVQVERDSLKSGFLIVRRVIEQSPAAKAGLRAGDQLWMLNNCRIQTTEQLGEQISVLRPGDIVPVIFSRAGVRQKRIITIGKIKSKFVESNGLNSHIMSRTTATIGNDEIQKQINHLEQEIYLLKSMIQSK